MVMVKVWDPTEEEEDWGEAIEVHAPRDIGEEQLPPAEGRQPTSMRDVFLFHYVHDTLLTSESLSSLKVAASEGGDSSSSRVHA